MPLPLAIAAGTAALGALAGAQGQQTSVKTNVAGPGALERQASGINTSMLGQLQAGVGMGPGQAEIAGGLQSSNALAAMLEQYSKGNFLPNASDFATANQFATSAFQPQQVAINQQFKQEQQRAAQLASQLGREVNDPIIQSRLSQERMQAQERLGAEQSAYASQFALSLPQQRLGFMAQAADVKNALASQAMANRQALLGLGQQQQQIGQQFRLGTATKNQTSGGGLQGAITGALAGFGSGLGAGSSYMNNMAQANYFQQIASQPTASMPTQPTAVAAPQMQSFASAPMTPQQPSVPLYLQPNSETVQSQYLLGNTQPWKYNMFGAIGQFYNSKGVFGNQ